MRVARAGFSPPVNDWMYESEEEDSAQQQGGEMSALRMNVSMSP